MSTMGPARNGRHSANIIYKYVYLQMLSSLKYIVVCIGSIFNSCPRFNDTTLYFLNEIKTETICTTVSAVISKLYLLY